MRIVRFFIWIIVLLLIAIGLYYFLRPGEKTEVAPSTQNLVEHPLFTEGLSSLGIEATDMGHSDFSSDGKYFLFNIFEGGRIPVNQAYLLNTESGEILLLPGFPERGFDDDRVVNLYSPEGIILYWLETNEYKTYSLGDNIFMTSLSPDGKTLVANTLEGLKKVDIDTGEITTLTTKQYDGAYAWFSDSTKMLGFQETDEDIFEAGKGRRLGVWNIDDGTFTPIPITLEQKSIRHIEWVIPNRVARVNAGWDDGSFDYLIDVTTNEMVYIGDTSASLMGGIVVDSKRGLFTVVGNQNSDEKVVMYKGMDLVNTTTLESGYFRESVEIVDENMLIYIRKSYGETGVNSQELVKLNINTGIETVIMELPMTYADVSLSPDHKTWVVGAGTKFYIGTL